MIFKTLVVLSVIVLSIGTSHGTMGQDDQDLVPKLWDSDFDGDGITKYRPKKNPLTTIVVENRTTIINGFPVEIAIVELFNDGNLIYAGTLASNDPKVYSYYDPFTEFRFTFVYSLELRTWTAHFVEGPQVKITELEVIQNGNNLHGPGPLPWDSDSIDDDKTSYQFSMNQQGVDTLVTLVVEKIVTLTVDGRFESYGMQVFQRNIITGNKDVLTEALTLTPHPENSLKWVCMDPRNDRVLMLDHDLNRNTWYYSGQPLEIVEVADQDGIEGDDDQKP